MGSSLRNIAAVSGKELRGYFASPIAWVMMALFALIFGRFFTVYLDYFLQQSMRRSSAARRRQNVNMQMIRPLLSNAALSRCSCCR